MSTDVFLQSIVSLEAHDKNTVQNTWYQSAPQSQKSVLTTPVKAS